MRLIARHRELVSVVVAVAVAVVVGAAVAVLLSPRQLAPDLLLSLDLQMATRMQSPSSQLQIWRTHHR